jgi:hypothetical protein
MQPFWGQVVTTLFPCFLFLYEDEFALFLLIPRSGFGSRLFFGLGCFSGFVGMRQRFFCLICYVGVCWVGWDEDEEACRVFVWGAVKKSINGEVQVCYLMQPAWGHKL